MVQWLYCSQFETDRKLFYLGITVQPAQVCFQHRRPLAAAGLPGTQQATPKTSREKKHDN